MPTLVLTIEFNIPGYEDDIREEISGAIQDALDSDLWPDLEMSWYWSC